MTEVPNFALRSGSGSESSLKPWQEEANPWLHALTVFAISLPLLTLSLALFFLLFTQTEPSKKEEAPLSIRVAEPPPPPKPVIPPPHKILVQRITPLPAQPNPPPAVSQNLPPPDTQHVTPGVATTTNPDSANLTGNTSAYVISKPMPEIPKEFRGKPMDISITVKFTIGPDGNAKVELTHASPDPKLNQWFLDTFRRWKFFPAIQNNQSVTSELLITVPIKVY